MPLDLAGIRGANSNMLGDKIEAKNGIEADLATHISSQAGIMRGMALTLHYTAFFFYMREAHDAPGNTSKHSAHEAVLAALVKAVVEATERYKEEHIDYKAHMTLDSS